MFLALQIVTICLAAVAMATALAHALELPGKLRLDQATYWAVQQMYYPGFTIAGLAEGLAILAALALVVMTPPGQPAFWWTLAGLLGLAGMHAVYWLLTHPVNKFWLKDFALTGLGQGFFAAGQPLENAGEASDQWRRYRDRWEYSHVLRAILAGGGFVALVIATVIR